MKESPKPYNYYRETAEYRFKVHRMLLNDTDGLGNKSFSCYDPSVVGYRYFAVVWGCVVTIVGTVGNLMTVLAFALDPRLRTRFNVLILNLAVADILYCAALQPVSVDSYLHLRWRGGHLWCRTFGFLLFLSNSVSILTLCLIAVSRYLLVRKRALFERVSSNFGLSLILLITWALGFASFGPLWSVYTFVPQVCTCSFDRIRGRPYTTILLFFYFFIGLSCVGLFYLLIYRRVQVAAQALTRYRFSRRSSKKNQPPTSSSQKTDDDSGVGGSHTGNTCSSEMSSQLEPVGVTWEKPPPAPSAQTTHAAKMEEATPPALIRAPVSSAQVPAAATAAPVGAPTPATTPGEDGEFKRVTRMCFIVFLCFVFCFVPFLMLNIADKNNKAPLVLHMFCANLTWLNSCINPVLYAVMNRHFRQAYHGLLSRAASPLTVLWSR